MSQRSARLPEKGGYENVLLVSNFVYHYRIPVYNQLDRRLRENGQKLFVATNKLQENSPHEIEFELVEGLTRLSDYKDIIVKLRPVTVILFLHIKDYFVWPLMYWMK